MTMKKEYRPVTISISISAETNRLLTESAKRSKRTKAIEAIIRLSESLRSVNHIEGHYQQLLTKY
ncbi:TraY domain-containing protein [Morganella morganii]|uniref:TraY domain-containing protein n=2 Tax=Morganella morganii TaxID=582 RepID=UPI000665F94D|nr:TraY domain-containing protein [Morganella morganii]EBV7123965.1 TraY domain-containing protein [Salmonella enterica subsp. enterica serovar Livingstone]MBT0358126.1 TraY domain-containing protein [Morganella morganii subsp. morganii]